MRPHAGMDTWVVNRIFASADRLTPLPPAPAPFDQFSQNSKDVLKTRDVLKVVVDYAGRPVGW